MSIFWSICSKKTSTHSFYVLIICVFTSPPHLTALILKLMNPISIPTLSQYVSQSNQKTDDEFRDQHYMQKVSNGSMAPECESSGWLLLQLRSSWLHNAPLEGSITTLALLNLAQLIQQGGGDDTGGRRRRRMRRDSGGRRWENRAETSQTDTLSAHSQHCK